MYANKQHVSTQTTVQRGVSMMKRFLSAPPPDMKSAGAVSKWFWTKSPAAQAAYPVSLPLMFGLGAMFYIGGRTLFGHNDVWFNKDKTHWGWATTSNPDIEHNKGALNSEAYRQNYRSRHEKHERDMLMDQHQDVHQAPYDFVTFRAGLERVPDKDVEL